MFTPYVGYVESVTDDYGAGRIRAVIPPDRGKKISEVPLSFPLLPKLMHIKPKVNEAVLVLVGNDKEANSQRLYIGPIISLMDKTQFDNYFDLSATDFLDGGIIKKPEAIENRITESAEQYSSSEGALPKDDEVALLGRKNTDIILSDDDVRIRAGVRQTKPNEHSVDFDNEGHSAYVKLKYHETPISENNKSTATIVADKINLISNEGDEKYSLSDTNEGINDEGMKKILEKAHRLPYGDILCEFFESFIRMYKNHYHVYPGTPPSVADADSVNFYTKYGSTKERLEDNLLSKNVRIS
jgi:hypothetical protein